MGEHAPAVSVIVPAYNSERFIGTALRSVIAQTVTDWELIVIDDHSTDGTRAVVEALAAEDPRIHYYANGANCGAAKARNRGWDLCRGRHIAFLDSDDRWHPEKLEKQLRRMEQTGADIVYCSYALVDDGSRKVKPDYTVPERVDYDTLLKENVIGCSTVLLSQRVTKDARFCTDFFHEDYVLWLQLLKEGFTAAGCRDILVDWRYTAGSRSFNKWNSAKNRWRIYREYLHLPVGKSIGLICNYATAGLRKYGKKSK